MILGQYSSPETALRELLSDIAPHNCWKVGYYHDTTNPMIIHAKTDLKPYEYQEAVLRVYLSRICMATREELGYGPEPIEPDEKVLPLKRQKDEISLQNN